jgi:phage/plasmid-associated DNA primase
VRLRNYRQGEDTLGAFLQEKCLLLSGLETQATQLYSVYRRWAEENGEYVQTQTRFGRALSERGIQRKPGESYRVSRNWPNFPTILTTKPSQPSQTLARQEWLGNEGLRWFERVATIFGVIARKFYLRGSYTENGSQLSQPSQLLYLSFCESRRRNGRKNEPARQKTAKAEATSISR